MRKSLLLQMAQAGPLEKEYLDGQLSPLDEDIASLHKSVSRSPSLCIKGSSLVLSISNLLCFLAVATGFYTIPNNVQYDHRHQVPRDEIHYVIVIAPDHVALPLPLA